ncbi:LamB/YcsF family protein [Tepidibacillus infernus]|uniref:5-oxoprolinase subunit A n=1 Tax=Tepidibacillus decaturensis TaxID=1413211 RepID=A0A135L1T4_9BACI|nr:5-oxoprolinase subunit PxpA [Tepidibacillus decaturensis]KXG42945.1 lactam utilization protein LamB [Tepidibacillus decaturensis]
MYSIDLNSDLGESYGNYRIGNDDEVLKYITSANIACGYHAGDHNVMMKTVKKAKELGVGVGAHPGFPDLSGFGRREIRMSPEEIYNMMIYQIGALLGVANSQKVSVQHVKPHGALYNMASKNKEMAMAIAKAVKDLDKELVLFALAGSELYKAGVEHGLKVAQEVFADRTYQPDGTLTSRLQPNAIIHDLDFAVERVIRMVKEGKVRAVNGEDIDIQADTICVHGDEPQALSFVKTLREKLKQEKIMIKNFGVSSNV